MCSGSTVPVAWGQSSPAASRRVEYSSAPDVIVVRYSEVAAELESLGAGRSVEVYGDGRVVSHYPAYMKRAGVHEIRIDEAELEALVTELVEAEVVEYDAEGLRRRREQLSAARRGVPGTVLYEVSDETLITIELNLERYRARDAPESSDRPVRKRIDYRGLRADELRYPEVEEIQRLARIRDRLRSVMKRAVLESGSAGATSSVAAESE